METALHEQLLLVICPECDEPGILPPDVEGLFGQCNACGQMFLITGNLVPAGFSSPVDRPASTDVDASPDTAPAETSDEPAPAKSAAEIKNAVVKPQPRWLRPAMYAGVVALLLVVLIGGRALLSGPDMTPLAATPQGTWPFPLAQNNNGFAWNRADEAKRMAICETLAAANNSQPGQRNRNAKWFCDKIHAFYNANPQAAILQLDIGQTAKICVQSDKSK